MSLMINCSACGIPVGMMSNECPLISNHPQSPAVLLRDTAEDRERLIRHVQALISGPRRVQIIENDAEGMGRLIWSPEFVDAILAALRGSDGGGA